MASSYVIRSSFGLYCGWHPDSFLGFDSSTGCRRRYQRRGLIFLRTLKRLYRAVTSTAITCCCCGPNMWHSPLEWTRKFPSAYDDGITADGRLGFIRHQSMGIERSKWTRHGRLRIYRERGSCPNCGVHRPRFGTWQKI
jgi:hypothetical protein